MKDAQRMKDKLNIAMLGHKRIPSREGGIEIVVEELSTRMVQAGNSVVCYNRSGHHVSGKEFDGNVLKEYKGIKLKSVLTINCKGLAAMTSSFFGALCCAFSKYDVVHFHAEGPCAMLWLPKLFGKRCVATIHGIDWQRAKWGGFASKYIKFGEKVAAKHADEIIVLSEGVQQHFMDTYGRKTVFIPNGVNRPIIRKPQLIKEKYNLNKDDYILFLGRLVPEKGITYLIEAFKNVKTNKKLVIAGGSSDTDTFMQELKDLANGDDRILFTGFVQGQMLEELYSNAYVYCLPSDLEGMPLSLLEAMSYGNCCLTSDIAECAEVVEDKALTFKKSDVEDLRLKLQYACDNPDTLKKLKDEAADFICQKYSWDDVVEKTMGVYQ
ncbi:MAG: glycosyltransferase family 4 protein [Coprococcus sp.]